MSNTKKRICQLISKLVETDFAAYDGERDEVLEDLEKSFDSMLGYANHVIMQQYQFPIWNARFEGEQFREKVSESDRTRRNFHLGACAHINMVNRLCVKIGVEELFPGLVASEDREGRRQAAVAIGTFICDLYHDGIGAENPDRAFDNATMNRNGETYDPEKTHRMLREMIGGV